ncbi:MAG: sulfatase [Opitutaceae bacterium]|nr:sulfatase [Opitutaceae bacterium]
MSRLVFLLVLGVSLAPGTHGYASEPRPPNIVLILADDLGWADLGCYGADLHETPRLDQLAREGLRFTTAYAMPVCSPSRAALLTGRHAARLQMTIWSEGSLSGPKNRRLLQASSRHDLPHAETTLAEILQPAGYLTALVGKWHLGAASHAPETQGFDINLGGTHWGAPQTFFWPYRGSTHFGGELRYVPHLEFGRPGEYLTDRLTDEALRVMDRAAATRQPFFLFLSHHAPHTPIEAKAADIEHFTRRLRPGLQHQNPAYAAMVRNLDENVGRVLDHLRDRGLERETIVIFASDNGGFIGRDRNRGIPVTSNAPLRSGKGSLYEGGIRIPLLIRWPGVTPGGAVCHAPVVLMDLFRTLCAVVPAAERVPVTDGVDLGALLRNPAAPLERDALFFHYPHYYETTTPVSAIRAGDWKLLEYLEDGRVELFQLREDPGETRDLAAESPAKVTELRTRLVAWRRDVGAQMPSPNPNFKLAGARP